MSAPESRLCPDMVVWTPEFAFEPAGPMRPSETSVEFVRADLYDALLARHEAALEALESLLNAATGPDYIFREQQAIDGLPGTETVFSKARATLSRETKG